MSNQRVKRQFAGDSADPAQRQITSFFHNSTVTTAPAADAGIYLKPVLPGSVQTNLLSVGMRVRKSVPEGYKVSGTSAFKIWTDNSTVNQITRPVDAVATRASSRELLPFCGINKVGGLDIQRFALSEDDDDYLPPLDEVPQLNFSQESVQSKPDESSRKRLFEEEEQEEEAEDGVLLAVADELGNRMTNSPVSLGDARLKAVPRSRTNKERSPPKLDRVDFKMSNDFEEAGFLVFGESQTMDITDKTD